MCGRMLNAYSIWAGHTMGPPTHIAGDRAEPTARFFVVVCEQRA